MKFSEGDIKLSKIDFFEELERKVKKFFNR